MRKKENGDKRRRKEEESENKGRRGKDRERLKKEVHCANSQ